MRTKKNNTTPRTKKAKSPQLRRLASSDLRRLPRPKAGFAQYLEPLLQLLEKFGDDLGTCPVDPAAMRASVAGVTQLGPQRQAIEEKLAELNNTILAESSAVWSQMLVIYGLAKAAARVNPDLRAAIEPFEEFMAIGHRTRPAAPIATP